MARVIGTRGTSVQFELVGLKKFRILMKQGKIKIKDGADIGVVKAGVFVEEEVKEDIAGNRIGTIRNVDTGLLINSIEFERTGEAEGIIRPVRKVYPGTDTTTQDVATILEFGTSRNPFPNPHFRNTEKRTKRDVRDIIQVAIKRKIG